MTQITLIRHGETDWNKQQIIQGRFDIPLNETGMEQARLTAQNFKDEQFDVFFTTPLIRTKQTALIIAKETNYSGDILVSEDLIERDFGSADGKPIAEFYDLVMAHKIPDQETEEEMKQRVMKALKEIVLTYPCKNILIVCHSHTIKAILNSLDESYDFKYKLQNCSITTLTFSDDKFILTAVNYNDYC